MRIGLATLRLAMHLPGSLKDKRRVSRSLISRLRNRFNVSVAEIASLDDPATITIAIACVSNSSRRAQSMIEKVVGAIEEMRVDAELEDYRLEII
jgi:uncharacterized protein YlxP (DUF503 family)